MSSPISPRRRWTTPTSRHFIVLASFCASITDFIALSVNISKTAVVCTRLVPELPYCLVLLWHPKNIPDPLENCRSSPMPLDTYVLALAQVVRLLLPNNCLPPFTSGTVALLMPAPGCLAVGAIALVFTHCVTILKSWFLLLLSFFYVERRLSTAPLTMNKTCKTFVSFDIDFVEQIF